jgi:tetratricopeptide (TPR) repeat protein
MNTDTRQQLQQLFRQAEYECSLGRTGRTIQRLDALLELAHDDQEFMTTDICRLTHRNLGTLYHDHDQHLKAARHIQVAIELGETATNDLCRKLGLSQFDNGEYAEAVRSLRKAIELDPLDEQAHYFVAWSFRKLAESATRRVTKIQLMRLAQNHCHILRKTNADNAIFPENIILAGL